MAVLNHDHLLEQAEKLIEAPAAGPPRQVGVRRAISAAYYSVFHFVLTKAADEFVGVTKRATKNYTLVYRSIDHRRLREVCLEIPKATLPPKYRVYTPTNGFGSNLSAFANAVVELQENRHTADYDPGVRLKTQDARLALTTARGAIARYQRASAARQRAFVTLLAFQPR